MPPKTIMRCNPYTAITIFVVLGVFALSMALSPFYIDGDQLHYRRVYDQISSLTLLDAYAYYRSNLDSRELIHFLLVYLISPYLDKDLVMSLSNAALAYAALRLCRTLGASPIIAALIPLTNYYFFAMYFSAERLKFAMLFMMLGLSYAGKYRPLYFYSFLAVLAHAQTTLVYTAILLKTLFRNVVYLFNTSKAPLYLLLLPLIVAPALALNLEQILSKLSSYSAERSIMEIARNAAFLLLTLCISRRKTDVIVLFIPILIATMLVGGDRVNMIGYLFFLYFALQYKKGLNVLNVGMTLYFAVKTIFFVDDFMIYGTGFPTE